MPELASPKPLTTSRLILFPAILSLAVTLLRLIGELRNWSETWFSKETGGVVPSGVSWIVGITWLAIPFGIYFALKLASAGRGPRSIRKALVYALIGLIIMRLPFLVLSWFPLAFPQVLIVIWLFMALAAVLQYVAWPDLFQVLLAYGMGARIPVVVVMFLAMLGNWGTHYDYVGMPQQFQMSLVPKFFWLAFFPQLIFWVGFTILLGSVAGGLTTALFARKCGVAL